MPAHDVEPSSFVDDPRAVVERRHVQLDSIGREVLAPVLAPGLDELQTQAAACQVGPQAEAVLEPLALLLEVEEADKRSFVVARGEETLGRHGLAGPARG